MNTLPRKPPSGELPVGLTLEKPARNLAAIATTDSLRYLQTVVLGQWKHKDTFAKLAKHGIRPIDRLLFYGPPGNGKTMAAQWLAQQIDAPLYRVQCESLVTAYSGKTATNVGDVMQWLETQPGVRRVIYPGLPSHPQHALAKRQMHGFGGMIALELDTDLGGSKRFLEACQVFTLAESLGGVESLIEHPAIMTHASLPPEQLAKMGIGDSLLRLSVGIESIVDLKEDLRQAFGAIQKR